jgi:hypothetical protein
MSESERTPDLAILATLGPGVKGLPSQVHRGGTLWTDCDRAVAVDTVVEGPNASSVSRSGGPGRIDASDGRR